jgi:predicted exporter
MLYLLISKHKKIYFSLTALFFAVFIVLFSQIKFKEDASEMLPASFSQELKLFQNSPLSNKIFVVIESEDEEAVQIYSAQVAAAFLNHEKIKFSAPKMDADFLLSYYYNAPNVWNKDFESKIIPLISEEAIASKMKENAKSLYSPEGMFTQRFVLSDPLGLLTVFAQELQKLNFSGGALEVRNGVLVSKNGRQSLLVFDYEKNFLDAGGAKEINGFFEEIKKTLPDNVKTFYMGAPRYTFENSELIQKDLTGIFFIAGFLMLVLFIVFFRDKKSLLIYVLPSFVVAFAGVIAAFVFGGVSGITICFGAVLTGLCIDYSVYVYFALKATKEEDRFKTVKLMFNPLAVSAATSIAGFLLLLLSDTAIFNQIAVFCASGLAAAFFIALFAMPFIFDCGQLRAKSENEPAYRSGGHRNRFFAAAVLAAIALCSFIGFRHVKFNSSFESLNTVSKEFEADKKVFKSLTDNAYGNNEFLFVFGKTKEEALENNEALAVNNREDLPLSALFPSRKQREKNAAAWKAFWTPSRILYIKNEINKAAKKYNIAPAVFNGFYAFLENKQALPDANVLERIYNPLIEYDGKYAFVNIVGNGSKIISGGNVETALISDEILSGKIKAGLFGSFYKIILLIVLCSFILIALFLKSVKSAVLAMIPPLCGLGVFFAAAALLKIEINIFGIFAMPLLIALGIDYGIFIIFKEKKSHNLLHPTKAVIVAALSTLIGFGSLMAAQHKVLFIIGFMVFTGILTSILVSIFIIPAFLKNKAAKPAALPLALLLVAVSLVSCSTGKIRYNAAEPAPSAASQEKTAMLYGVYRDDLNFRVIAVTDKEGARVVIMNDIGVKLQDMKLTKDAGTDLYFVINFMPKNTIEEFERIFRKYFIDKTEDGTKTINNRLYFYEDGEPVLWISKI